MYKGQAAEPRPRTAADPTQATHSYAGAGAPAWGRFEANDPDKRFRVLAGSGWRKPVLNPEATRYDLHLKLAEQQDHLVADGVLDPGTMTFPRDHIFDNWTIASRVISGKATHSGGYHWQLLTDASD